MFSDNLVKYLYCQVRKLRQQVESIISGEDPIVHLIGSTDSPEIEVGDGAGIGATAGISGDDLGGSIDVSIGATPEEGGIVVSITFAVVYDSVPYVILSDGDDNYSMGITGVVKVTNATTTGFEISAKSGITLDPGNYKWNYIIKQ